MPLYRMYEKMIPYIQKANRLRFLKYKNYAIIKFNENTDDKIQDIYPKLNIPRRFFRYIYLPIFYFKGKRYYIDNKILLKIRQLYKLYPFKTKESFEKITKNHSNLYIEATDEINTVYTYYKDNWRNKKLQSDIRDLFSDIIDDIPEGYKKIGLYYINITQPFTINWRFKKIIILLKYVYKNELPFDDLLLALNDGEKITYIKLMEDKEINYTKFLRILKKITPTVKDDKQIKRDIANISSDEENEDQTKFNQNNIIASDIINASEDKEDKEEIINHVKSNNISGLNILKKKQIISSPDRSISVQSSDELNNTYDEYDEEDILITNEFDNKLNIIKNIQEKISIATHSERHNEKMKNLTYTKTILNDAPTIFNKHEKDDIKLKLKKFNIVEKKEDVKSIHITTNETILLQLEFELHNGNTQKIEVEIPKLENGYYILNGQRKILMNQLLVPPIFFYKKGGCIIQTSFGLMKVDFKIKYKRKNISALIGGRNVSYPFIFIFHRGFESGMNLMFGENNWKISNQKEPNMKNVELSDGFINISVSDEIKETFFESFEPEKWKILSIEHLDNKDKYNSVLEDERIYNLVNVIMDKIIDVNSKSVLENMKYPTDIDDLLIYIVPKLLDGYVDRRNDLSIMRLRNSEILFNIINRTFEKKYSEYRMDIMRQKKDVKLNLRKDEIISAFLTNSLVSGAEYVNPIEDVTNRYKITYTGQESGGLGKDAVTLKTRNIDDTFYGVIDPCDSPIGASVGVVQHLTKNASFANSTGQFNLTNNPDADILSITTSLIPFVEKNDTTRTMMSCNQMKQATLLTHGESPIVQSGSEIELLKWASDSYVKRSPVNGVVSEIVINKHIIITDKDNKQHKIDIYPIDLHSGQGLSGYQEFRIIVKHNQKVKEDQIIAMSKYGYTEDGIICTGINAITAFMPYENQTYEDAVVISEELVEQNRLQSVHTVEVEAIVSPDDCVNIKDFNITIGKKYNKDEIIFKFIPNDLSILGEYIEKDDLEKGYITVKAEYASTLYDWEAYLIGVENYMMSDELKAFVHDNNIPIIKKERFYYKKELVKGLLLICRFKKLSQISIGDKLNNRYGNKGVISMIEKKENMPVLEDGRRVQIIFNPLGVTRRNNFPQIMELHCGNMGYRLSEILQKSKRDAFVAIIKKVYSILDKTNGQRIKNMIVDSLTNLSEKEFNKLKEKYKTYFPIIIMPFKSPSISELFKAMTVLKLKSMYKVYLPKYKTWSKKDICVGYTYIQKLEHMAEKKMTARSTGKYQTKISQPIAGSKAGGGQRLGELDSFALMSHSSNPIIIEEFFGLMSDDQKIKKKIIQNIIDTGEASIQIDKYGTSPTKQLLYNYFKIIGVDLESL